MKKLKEKICPLSYFFTILVILCLIPSMAFSQSRGIKVVAIDKATKEWKEIPLYNKTYAVIIGIDNYPKLSPEFQLSYAVSDAKAIERMLRSKFLFNKIYTLYNEQATKSNILDLLLNKLSKISKDDAVFVFFAGHGGQEQTDFGPLGFIVPQDGNFSDMRKVISMSTIRDDISKRIRAKHVFYTMDSCYSGILVTKRGATSKETRRDIAYLQQIAKEQVRQVLTAGSANQAVLDGGPGGHSVFAGRFLEILDEADDFITATEISTLVKERVFSDAQARNHIQTPKSGELFGLGDFIFMPSLTKKLGSIEQQISGLEKELQELNQIEIIANQQKDKAALREAERKRKVAEAKLEAKKIEGSRLNQEKIEKEKKEKERIKELADQKKKEAEENARLTAIQQEVEKKRKQYKTSMVSSLDEAVKEMQASDKEINNIKNKYLEDLKKRIINIASTHSENFSTKTLQKDEFETESEYQARLANSLGADSSHNHQKFAEAMKLIKDSYDSQVAPLLTQQSEISKNIYTFYGHDALQIKLGKYNAEDETFNISVGSKNIKRPIYSNGRFLFVQDSSRQAKKIGIKKGDMIFKYNNIIVPPNVDWNQLKQTVVTNNVKIEIDRDGKLIPFTLQKGRIGISTKVDDYLSELNANNFIVNGKLHVPRGKARKFKQNYLNKFITAELKVRAVSKDLSLVNSAIVIDESDDNKYDLFRSPYINIGNRMTIDTKNKIIWLTKIRGRKLSWQGVEKYLNNLNYRGISDWRQPTLIELTSLHGKYFRHYFGFGNHGMHTGTLSGNTTDKQHNFIRNKTYSESRGLHRDFLSVRAIGQYANSNDIFSNRFISLGSSMLFDNYNKIIWLAKPLANTMTWREANTLLKDFQAGGFKGWRLPSINELQSLYDNTIPGMNRNFDLPNEGFHSNIKSGKTNKQYNPKRNRTYDESIDNRRKIICVM